MGRSLRVGEWIRGFVFGRRRVCSISRLLLNIVVPSWFPPSPIPIPDLSTHFSIHSSPFAFLSLHICVLTSLEPRVQSVNKSIILHQFRSHSETLVPQRPNLHRDSIRSPR